MYQYWYLFEAYQSTIAVFDKYEYKDEEWDKQTHELLEDLWVTFVVGLLIECFRAPSDKVSLRSQVVKGLELLKRPKGEIAMERLPCVLRTRCQQAVALKVSV